LADAQGKFFSNQSAGKVTALAHKISKKQEDLGSCPAAQHPRHEQGASEVALLHL
jgi:hypothetical protein